jgi:hypothetical protein
MTTSSRSQAEPDTEIKFSSRARASALIRETWAQSAKEDGNNNTLWESALAILPLPYLSILHLVAQSRFLSGTCMICGIGFPKRV